MKISRGITALIIAAFLMTAPLVVISDDSNAEELKNFKKSVYFESNVLTMDQYSALTGDGPNKFCYSVIDNMGFDGDFDFADVSVSEIKLTTGLAADSYNDGFKLYGIDSEEYTISFKATISSSSINQPIFDNDVAPKAEYADSFKEFFGETYEEGFALTFKGTVQLSSAYLQESKYGEKTTDLVALSKESILTTAVMKMDIEECKVQKNTSSEPKNFEFAPEINVKCTETGIFNFGDLKIDDVVSSSQVDVTYAYEGEPSITVSCKLDGKSAEADYKLYDVQTDGKKLAEKYIDSITKINSYEQIPTVDTLKTIFGTSEDLTAYGTVNENFDAFMDKFNSIGATDDKGLSTTAIIAIAAGSVVAVALIAGIIIFFKRKG